MKLKFPNELAMVARLLPVDSIMRSNGRDVANDELMTLAIGRYMSRSVNYRRLPPVSHRSISAVPVDTENLENVDITHEMPSTTELELLTSIAPSEVRWRAPFMGERFDVAENWFEVQDLVARVGDPGFEFLVVQPAWEVELRHWAQCLGRPQAMTVEVALWDPEVGQVDLSKLGRRGARFPWVNVHADPELHELVRPCQVLTARDAIIAFYDWLVHGHVDGFTREHFAY